VVDEIGPHAANASPAITTTARRITVAELCTDAGYAARTTFAAKLLVAGISHAVGNRVSATRKC
jgi:hypothetical protein